MLPAPEHLRKHITWKVNQQEIDAPNTWICTSYMSRGQDRNIESPEHLCELSFSMPKAIFLELIGPWYATTVAEEKADPDYEEGEFWSADLLRSRHYPTLEVLWKESQALVARLVLEYEIDLMDLVAMPIEQWKDHTYFVHRMDGFVLDQKALTITGTGLSAPNHIQTLLGNLIRNLADPAAAEWLLLSSMAKLVEGRQKAVEAIPAIRALESHTIPSVSEAARQARIELETYLA